MDKSIVYVVEALKYQCDSECSVEKGEVIRVHDDDIWWHPINTRDKCGFHKDNFILLGKLGEYAPELWRTV
jgi:hypothetical protein